MENFSLVLLSLSMNIAFTFFTFLVFILYLQSHSNKPPHPHEFRYAALRILLKQLEIELLPSKTVHKSESRDCALLHLLWRQLNVFNLLVRTREDIEVVTHFIDKYRKIAVNLILRSSIVINVYKFSPLVTIFVYLPQPN